MIVSFISKKGGVGKTTSAVHVAAALAADGHRTLLVDLDSQASASLFLGVARSALAPSVADLMAGRCAAPAATRATGVAGLDLMTASADLVSVDVDYAARRDRELLLGRALAPLRERYEWIVLDSPPALTVLPVNALAASDFFVVPVVPQFLAFDGLDLLIATVRRLRERHGLKTRCLGFLLTMVDRRTRMARENIAALRARFGERIFAAEVPLNVRLAEAPARGRTVFDHAAEATGAIAYRLVAQELVARATPRDPGTEIRGQLTQFGSLNSLN